MKVFRADNSVIFHYGAIHLRDLRISIRKQLEVQSFFSAKRFVRFSGIYTYTADHGISGCVLIDVPLKVVRLKRAAAGKVLWIKIKDNPFSFEITQARRSALICR